MNLALNLYTQGIHPNVDFSDIQSVIDIVTQCNDLPVHPRHPYAGELVFTAFSGSHQDAIKKGFEAQKKKHAAAAAKREPQYWDIPYLPIDPADLGCSYEAVIRVNSQSGKGGIAYLVKEHLKLDLPRKMQIAFYQVIQEVSDREAREMTVDDITTAFRRKYYFGGKKYEGRLTLRSFKVSTEPSADLVDSDDEAPDERRRFDGTITVDGVVRVIRGDGNGPLSAFLDALRTHLKIDLSIREYSEHTVEESSRSKAASYVELVPTSEDVKDTRRSAESWWGVSVDADITGSGLRAVLSAVNSAIGDRELPELKLSVGFGASSGQSDIANVIVNSLKLELPRRFQASFFEVVQRTARGSGGHIGYDALTDLFQSTYSFGVTKPSRFNLDTFKMENIGGGRRKLVADVVFEGQVRQLMGEGNGPLSAVLAALHSQIAGTLSIREYSEHSIGTGSEVQAASYVELVYELAGRPKESGWGVSTDEDITASGLKAVLRAASILGVVVLPAVNGQ